MGTRGSRLSVAQTSRVICELEGANPGCRYETVPITTRGDTDPRPLFAIDQKGIFEKEVDRAVAEKKVDFAVHSLKDVPSDLPGGLCLACVPKREQVNDVLISKDGLPLEGLPQNATVGTSSLRRAVQIARKRPDITVRPIRGNIETRIKKIDGSNYHAVVLASAGVRRLGLDVRLAVLPVDDFSPSPGQGALAIVARKDDHGTISMLEKIQDPDSRAEAEAERALSSAVGSGCRFPVGAYARSGGGMLTLRVSAFSVDGSRSIAVERAGPKSDPVSLGNLAAAELRERGIDGLALNWREKVEEWNRK